MGISNILSFNEKQKIKKNKDLIKLKLLIESDLQKVNELTLEHMQSYVPLIPKIAGYLINSGGKRIRPIITIACSKLFGANEDGHHIAFAACVEFIHTAGLLHDDVVDKSDMRRGQKSANSIWGNHTSVLVGDFLLSRAFKLMVAHKNVDAMRVLSNASSIITEGEIQQLIAQNELTTSYDQYLNILSAKTAILFEAAAELGGLAHQRGEEDIAPLRAFGKNLGITFQLIDDILDYKANQKVLGKSLGDDFYEGKITLPIILCHQLCTPKEKEFWSRTIEKGNFQQGDFEHALELMTHYNVFESSIEIARSFGNKAEEALNIFPESEIKSALKEVIKFSIERAY